MAKSRIGRKKSSFTIPGTVTYTGNKKSDIVSLHYLQYNEENIIDEEITSKKLESIYEPVPSMQWYDIRGVHNTNLIEGIGQVFHLHPLVLEDIADVNQRPKFEEYDEGLFIILHALKWNKSELEIEKENVNIFVGSSYVITFQEGKDDIFKSIRERIILSQGRVRQRGPDYLAFAITDFIIEGYMDTLDEISGQLESLEINIEKGADDIREELMRIRPQLIQLKRTVQPAREAMNGFSRSTHKFIDQATIPFLRDLYGTTIQLAEYIDTQRDMLSSLQDLHLSILGQKANKVVQLLTIITTIFVPITFLAGVYGMNFEHMPELQWKYSYYSLLFVMLSVAISLIFVFKKKKWM
jgi:magnesium transporter